LEEGVQVDEVKLVGSMQGFTYKRTHKDSKRRGSGKTHQDSARDAMGGRRILQRKKVATSDSVAG